MLLREFKKGVKELFAKLEKILNEVFGFGEEVADNALTPAEKRWKKKQQKTFILKIFNCCTYTVLRGVEE